MRPCFAHCNGTHVSSGIPRTPIKLEVIGVDPLFLTSVLIAVIWHESTQQSYSTTDILPLYEWETCSVVIAAAQAATLLSSKYALSMHKVYTALAFSMPSLAPAVVNPLGVT